MQQRRGIIVGAGILLVLVIWGIIGWQYFASPTPLTELLPEKTLLLAAIPNGTTTWTRYQGSQLKQFWNSQEMAQLSGMLNGAVQNALGKTVSAEDQKEVQAFAEAMGRNLTGESFIAVTGLDYKDPAQEAALAGLHPLQGTGDFEQAVQKLAAWIKRKQPSLKTGQGQHGKWNYQWVELPKAGKICFAAAKGWALTSWNEPALFDFLDRLSGSAETLSLSHNVLYSSIWTKLDPALNPDAYVFVNVQRAIGGINSQIGDLSPQMQRSLSGMADAYRPFPAVLFTTRFNGAQVEDQVVILSPPDTRPDLGMSYQVCAFKSLGLTTQDTLVYLAQNIDLEKQYAYLHQLYQNSSPQAVFLMDSMEKNLSNMGIDLHRNLLQALGPELAIFLDWPDKAEIPTLAILFQFADKGAFQPAADKLIQIVKTSTGQIGSVSESSVGDNKFVTLNLDPRYKVSPTLFFGTDFFGIFLTKDGAIQAVTKDDANTLGANGTFQGMAAPHQGDAQSMVFADTPRLLKKTYASLKPFAPMVAAMMGTKETLKLPDQLSFADACGPYEMTSSVRDDHIFCQSMSGIGNQMILGGGLLGGSVGLAMPAITRAQAQQKAAVQQAQENAVTPENVRSDLRELRVIIESWSKAQNVPAGTTVTWNNLTPFLVPGTPLAQSNGKDRLGNPYVLGAVGGPQADVSDQTKAFFAGKVKSDFWSESAMPSTPSARTATPSPSPVPAPAPTSEPAPATPPSTNAPAANP